MSSPLPPAIEASADDRRAHQRHRVFRVEVRIATPETFRASYLRDLSHGGIFVRSARPLPVGVRVAIHMVVAGEPPLALAGAVVRHAPGGFGVKFDTPTPSQRKAIDTLIEHTSTPGTTAPEDVAMALAEARGSIEAYEESLARLRESEAEAQQRAEQLELERNVLADGVRDLSEKLARLRSERQTMAALLAESRAALQAREPAHEPADHELAHLKELTAECERLRAELQDATSQLDDERLKAMALQRALERFAAMGGTIPPRK